MKKKNVFKKLIKNNRAGWVTIAGMITIFLLFASCAGQNNKQTLSENGGDKEGIECRWIVPTGSTLREKVCATKAAWAEKDRRAKRDKDRFYDDTVDPMRQRQSDFEDTGAN